MKNKKTILFYTANGIGLGHLRRTQLLAKELKSENIRIVLAASDKKPHLFGDFFDSLVRLTPVSDELFEKREIDSVSLANGQKFLKSLKKYKPDVVVADFHLNSFCVYSSFRYALDRFSVRSIFVWRLNDKKTFLNILNRDNEKLRCFEKIILPHSSNELKDLLSLSVLEKIKKNKKFKIVGSIFQETENNFDLKKYNIGKNDFLITLTVGGGGKLEKAGWGQCDNPAKIINQFLDIYPSLLNKIKNLKTIVVTGPYLKGIKKKTYPGLKLIEFESNLPGLIKKSNLLISAAGYNTCNEIIETKMPALFTPLKRGDNEQLQRALSFRDKGVARVFQGKTPESLLENILEVRKDFKKLKKNFEKFPQKISGNKRASQEILNNLNYQTSEYFLKTSLKCNNNCVYCNLLNKRSRKEKSLKDIQKELEKARAYGYQAIRLSCNTDIRKDFIDILKLIRSFNFRIFLETNARIFYYSDFLRRIDKYVNQYEPYLNFSSKKICQGITGESQAFDQTIKGIENILKFSKKDLIVKVVLVKDISLLLNIIERLSQMNVKSVKFIYPFRFDQTGSVLSLVESVSEISKAKKFAKSKKIKVITGQNLEFNPYLPDSLSFFDTRQAELKINFRKYKEKPEFSIIIPTFNRGDIIKSVIEGFFNQEYIKSRYEIIVVDDGSNDNTLEVIEKLKPTCNFKYLYWPRKKVIFKKEFKKWANFYNRAGLARNIGVSHAQGKIILFNDADILVNKNCLKKHSKHHNRHSDIVVRGFRMFSHNASNKSFYPEKPEREKKLHCRVYDLSKEGWHRIVTCNLSLKKEYLENIDGFSRDYVFWGFEDTDLGYRLKGLGLKFIWDDKIKVRHLYHEKESGGGLKDLLNFHVGANIMYRKYLNDEIYDIFRDVIFYKLDNHILK